MGGRRRATMIAAAAAALAFAAPAGAAWVPGDLHIHTCFSHDGYCPPTDDNTGPDTFYSTGGTVQQRFLEAKLKGLGFLAITDHDDIRAQSDPAYGSQGVTAVDGYETSLAGGHAQMLGARKAYSEGTGDAASINAMANALRADGGVFQANHPSYRAEEPVSKCDDFEDPEETPMHWKYGFTVRPDVIEVWNATALIPPSELFWDCWLQHGARIGATGGSDSHGATQPHIGLPTTWVNAPSAKLADVLAALRAGRTTLSRQPERMGGVRLVLEADADRNGTYETGIGGQVPPSTPMRVRADGLPGRGLVRVRANGRTPINGQDLRPGGSVTFNAPPELHGWVRANLYLQHGSSGVDPACGPGFPTGQALDACSEDLATAAMTSPIWVGPPVPPVKPPPPDKPPPDDPDPGTDPRPVPPDDQGGPKHPPNVPPQRGRGQRIKSLRVAWYHRTRWRRPRVLIHWSAVKGPIDLQLRPGGKKKWRTIRRTTKKRGHILRLRRGPWTVRIRSHPAFGRPGPWKVKKVRITGLPPRD